MRRALAVCLLVLVAGACQKKKKEAPVPEDFPHSTSAAVPTRAPPEPPLALAPAAASAPREERERAVWELILGEKPAKRLVEVATDPGRSLDPGRRERLAPSKVDPLCTCHPADPLCECPEPRK